VPKLPRLDYTLMALCVGVLLTMVIYSLVASSGDDFGKLDRAIAGNAVDQPNDEP
jgi:hypothetical protein